MEHLSAESIITHLDGKTPDAEISPVEAHLATCDECSESMKQFRALQLRLRLEPRFRPPADAVKAWLDQFPVPPQPDRPSLRQILASLTYDSFDQPLLAGVRHPGAAPRQLIFRAGEIDVDVKIESTERDEFVSLTGQVLSSKPNFFDNASVGLESDGVIRYRTHTNEVGEFSFEVPKDTYNLSIDLPEGQLTILSVHPGTARN
jgi:hypothetical protein